MLECDKIFSWLGSSVINLKDNLYCHFNAIDALLQSITYNEHNKTKKPPGKN